MNNQKISGIMVYYYFVCKKKLWLFHHGISMEDQSELVRLGKYIDENTYKAERKHILINGEINIDFIRKSNIIHEIKKSRKIEEASIWQVKYYLFYLKRYGLSGIRAKLDYPLLKQSVEVELTEEDERRMAEILDEIVEIISSESVPPTQKKKLCRNCAFYDLCML